MPIFLHKKPETGGLEQPWTCFTCRYSPLLGVICSSGPLILAPGLMGNFSPSNIQCGPERRHGSTRVPGHVYLAWCSSWRMVEYIYYITEAWKSISWAVNVVTVRKRRAVRLVHHVQNHTCRSLSSSQSGGTSCCSNPLAFGLIGKDFLSALTLTAV